MNPPVSAPSVVDPRARVDLPRAELSQNARTVLAKRYLRKDETGKPIEEPEEMFWRVASVIAAGDARYGATEEEVEALAREFYLLMTRRLFEPNSPTLMNAGRPLGQLSACFVLPVEDALSNGQSGIYDTLRSMALVHQSGGGCVAGDAHVYTTFCGVEQIETLYERVRALGIPEMMRENHRVMDVAQLGIRTFAVDPATGRFDHKQVTHLWQWDVPAEQQYTVRCSNGSEVTTSAWHPFMVFTPEGIVERRTDALGAGDILLTPNRSVREAWPFADYKEAEGFRLDERLAWLVGYFLGDGSLDVFHNRTQSYTALRARFFDGRPESIRYAAGVLAEHGVEVTPQQDSRGLWQLTTTNREFVPAFARLAELEPGAKESLTLPEWVAKSPLSVVGAFLGGLIDSDGYVSLDRRRVEFSTVCPELARRLVSLLSALGLNPAVRAKQPGRKGKRVEYRIHLADAKKTPALVELVAGWVHDPLKRARLAELTQSRLHNTHLRVPVPFEALAELLQAAGVPPRTRAIHKEPVTVGGEEFWLHRAKWGIGIGEDKLRRLAQALRRVLPAEYADRIEQLERLADGSTVVESVARAAEARPFYDFTVADFNNYLAGGGNGKLVVIHNTGFSFSRLRPAGDIVRSTTGVASGPVSFMSLYDSSTEVVKQGGTRRGANMGILRVDHPDILEFIDCKQDITKITNFNISVAVTDAFMQAVEKGEEYELKSPRSGEVVGRLDARMVWDKIVQNAWKTGEPGVFYIDRANHYNPVPHLGSYEATNPCLTGDAQVLTVEGPRRFDELAAAGDDVLVHAIDRQTGRTVVRWMRAPRLTRRDVEVFEIEFDSGLRVRCTPAHSWIGLEGEKLRAAALLPGMRVQAFLLREVHEPSFVPANHRVVAVRDAGRADVYNGTVDDVHTYVVCDPASVDPASAYTGVVSANCGEQPLLPYDVCNLGSVNVGAFVRSDIEADAPWYEKIDWKEYRRVVRLSTHFLDNVIDANQYPLPEIHDLAQRIRRIGLGVMGFADLLVRVGVPYNSPEGVEVGRRIMEFMDEESKKQSEILAEKRGVFPEWEQSIWGPDETAARAPDGERIRPMRRLRNCNVTTVAPTGTISIFAGCSSGIEPLFAVAFMRNQAGALMPDVNEDFVRVAKADGWYSEELMQRIAEQGHIHFPEVPEEVQRTFVTAHDITPEWHVRMQAAFQEYTDSAISKTTNFPHDATTDDVRQIYELAFSLGCKGVTVYRDGSRDNQVLSTGATKTPAQQAADAEKLTQLQKRVAELEAELKRAREAAQRAEQQAQQVRRQKRRRPDVLRGITRKMSSPLGDVFVTINEDEQGNPFEVFAVLGKAGSIATADAEAVGRLISLALRFGVPVGDVHSQLRGISSDRAIGFGQNKVLSVPDAIAQAIELREREKLGIQQELIPNGSYRAPPAPNDGSMASLLAPRLALEGYDPGETFIGICPDCQSQLEFAEGCMKCHACGYSECG